MNSKALSTLWEITDQIVASSRDVTLNESYIEKLAAIIKEAPRSNFCTKTPECKSVMSEHIINTINIAYHLLANSVNYCYWYSQPTIRPNQSSSSKMHKVLAKCFDEIKDNYDYNKIEFIAQSFAANLTTERFPMIKERVGHLSEFIGNNFSKFCNYKVDLAHCIISKNESFEFWLDRLIVDFPGYGEDLFLKRASLIFGEMYRAHRWFANDIFIIPTPIDYHIPNVLRHYKCTAYSKQLSNLIQNNELIPSNSRLECEIRANALKACKMLSDLSKKPMMDIDMFLFENRKIAKTPFHLTLTTNY